MKILSLIYKLSVKIRADKKSLDLWKKIGYSGTIFQKADVIFQSLWRYPVRRWFAHRGDNCMIFDDTLEYVKTK